MEYRNLPHGGEKIGIIGLGSSVIGEQPEQEIIRTVQTALKHGINYFDMAGGHATIFEAYGKALEGHYMTLEKKAGDCIGCGHCDRRCPFHVKQSDRMKMICEKFGA